MTQIDSEKHFCLYFFFTWILKELFDYSGRDLNTLDVHTNILDVHK
jgi:hypothetical protein